MGTNQVDLLVVDDEEFNRHILKKSLSDAGYAVTLARDGEEAWEILNSGEHDFATILLDRMMPRLDGIGLLERIKADGRFANLPVVFQTAAADPADIVEGMKEGAFYYLIKPIDKDVMLAIVQIAVSKRIMAVALLNETAEDRRRYFAMLQRAEFAFRTLSDARALAAILADFYPDPQRVLLGFSELLANAVEHGNLGISYTEKSKLLMEGKWEDEIERRLALPEYAEKRVSVLLEHTPQHIRATITDCGAGFDWNKYLEMSPERAFDPNGRGIAMSRMMSFDSMEYLGKGNQVATTVKF